ncbi:DNA repair protein RecO [bacterium]|nr:DNA repair protein RecO [bacterium]
MKQNFTTNAINLKTYNLSEADKIVLMYSQDRGLIRGVAKGGKKTTSKLGGRMDLLVANKLMLNKGRNLDTICQAEALNTFINLRNDMDKLLYSLYASEIVSNFGVEEDPNSEEIYSLFYSFLNRVSEVKTKTDILLAVLRFQLKMMSISGYSIEFDRCVKCSSELKEGEALYFSVKSGGIICPHCLNQGETVQKMHDKLRLFLKTLTETDFNAQTRYDELATEKVCLICVNLLTDYIKFYSPKKFQTVKMLESV